VLETAETKYSQSSFEVASALNVDTWHEWNANGISIDIRRIWWDQKVSGRIAFTKDCVEYQLQAGRSPTQVVRDRTDAMAVVGPVIFVPQGWQCEVECEPSDMVKMCVAIDDHPIAPHSRSLPLFAEPRARWDIRDVRVAAVLRRMADEVLAPGFAHDVLLELLFGQLLIELSRINDPTDRSDQRRTKVRLRDVLAHIEAGLDQPIEVSALASRFGTTPRTLLRLFREETGSSVSEYVSAARIRRAQHELASGTAIKVVAFRCGFKSSSAFSTAFRRATGTTPADFQRNDQTSPR
jgi:AraC family transcriptional regulator